MRKADIKLGVVYAYQDSLGPPRPAVILSTDLYSTRGRLSNRDEYAARAIAGTKPGTSYMGVSTGYLAVVPDYGTKRERGDLTRDMLAFSLADAEKVTDGDLGGDLHVEVITTLAKITGPYDEVMAERAASVERERQQRQEDDAARRARDERKAAIVSRFSVLDLTVSPDYRVPDVLTLSLAEAEAIAEKLEGLLP
jgi:hypothetical protein